MDKSQEIFLGRLLPRQQRRNRRQSLLAGDKTELLMGQA
jgi:hypothetical protein